MIEDAIRRFDLLGRILFGVQFAIASGLAVCWAGLSAVDNADRLLTMLALVGASLYLAISCLVAGVVYDSVESRLAHRYYTLAGVGGVLAFIAPVVAKVLQ